MALTHIFFDLDGTLTDPGIGITSAVMYALAKFGIEEQDRTALYSFNGPPLLDSFRDRFGFNTDQCFKALGYYREYFEAKGIFENKVYPGIPDLLSSLQQNGLKLVLASSKPEMYTGKILEHFNLERYFVFLAGSLPDERRSKKSEVIAYALNSCGIHDTSAVLMVGDRRYDIAGAHENNIKAAGVLYGYGSREEMKSAGADYITDTVQDTKQLLVSISSAG